MKFGPYPFLFVFSGFAGALMIFSVSVLLSRLFKQNRFIINVSSGCIVILGFHRLIMNIFKGLVTDMSLPTMFAFTIFVFAICYVIILVIKRWFPIIMGYRK